jgi:hypothetical protein
MRAACGEKFAAHVVDQWTGLLGRRPQGLRSRSAIRPGCSATRSWPAPGRSGCSRRRWCRTRRCACIHGSASWAIPRWAKSCAICPAIERSSYEYRVAAGRRIRDRPGAARYRPLARGTCGRGDRGFQLRGLPMLSQEAVPARDGPHTRRVLRITGRATAALWPRTAAADRRALAVVPLSGPLSSLDDERAAPDPGHVRRLHRPHAPEPPHRDLAASVAHPVGGVDRRPRQAGSAHFHRFRHRHVLMRSAGCAVNDYADRSFDPSRRAHRRAGRWPRGASRPPRR